MKPLYMWAGGKNKMIPKYLKSPGIPYQGYDTFVEPFFGGGAMMIHIAENALSVKRFILNDINTEIVGLYKAIKDDVKYFIEICDEISAGYLLLSREDRKELYYKIRKIYIQDHPDWTPTQESAILYFLMKTAFNGIWQSTIEAKGKFCTPCGLLNQKDKVYDKNNVLEWNKFLQKVDIYSGDWKECVNNIEGKSFYFMDPPYRGSFTQYAQEFGDDKHQELIEFCKESDAKGHFVMYCNRDINDNFYNNKGNLSFESYPITYTAGRRATEKDGKRTAKSATEILLFSQWS